MASNCELTIEPLNGMRIEQIPGGLPVAENKISVGNICYGQSRDIIVKFH